MSDHIQTTLRLATPGGNVHVREVVRYSDRVRTPDFMSRDTLPEGMVNRIEVESITSVIVVICSGVIVFRFFLADHIDNMKALNTIFPSVLQLNACPPERTLL